MNLGVQYYRAPFPNRQYWDADFSRIRDAGFNTVQLWVLWAWVESTPDRFIFDDYDELVSLAEGKGLGVVLSTKAEIHPHWIHRVVPGSEMIDHMGHKVISSQRLECHFGLTPGGCTDHPGVWERMKNFLTAAADRYKDRSSLRGWDAWNELRWNVHADGYVCYCAHTLAAYRAWLKDKFGDLAQLNHKWQRRYGIWEEVMPGKMPVRPFTEMMTFQHFLTERANDHATKRCNAIKNVDRSHPVTVHAASPCPLEPGGIGSSNVHLIEYNQAINRGNDWAFADNLEGIGCSSFPKWGNLTDTDFSLRMNFVHSAARGKRIWLSELQGSAAMTENRITPAVSARDQQRWLWQGVTHGADTILFWCWRDEVFGREAGGFGIAGHDGFADQRLAAMKETAKIIGDNEALLADAKLDTPQVGVLFSPQSYYLNWSQEGNADLAMNALQNYCRALSRNLISYRVVEEEHLDSLVGLKVLFLPRVLVIDELTEKELEKFVRGGGVIVAESECGAWSSLGIWRYPEERWLARLTGVRELGRRMITKETASVYLRGKVLPLRLSQWLTPLVGVGDALSPYDDNGTPASLLMRSKVADGVVYTAGSFFGNSVVDGMERTFDSFVKQVVSEAGVVAPVEITHLHNPDAHCQVTCATVNGKKLVGILAPEGESMLQARFAPGFIHGEALRDIMTGRTVAIAEDHTAVIHFDKARWGIALLQEL
ncbi:MAG: alpha-amylase family protein [Candidatus Sumerlaeota bacterium]